MARHTKFFVVLSLLALAALGFPQRGYDRFVNPLREKGLREMRAFSMLESLTKDVGHRLSGSEGDRKAVAWALATMKELGFENVRAMPVMVPHWVRGDKEELIMTDSSGASAPLTATALGGSIATPSEGISAEVIEVQSLEEAAALGERAKGKILFYNRPMDPTQISTFAAYGGAVNQRGGGAIAAGKVGAVAALVRSMTMRMDDEPHTGSMRYEDGVTKVPAAALSLIAAEKLSAALKKGSVTVRLILSCQTLPDAESANVVGELVGTEKPDEVIVIGGHLDSWDKGTGAHDDGAGCVQSLDALRLIKELGWKPKRTIRVVLFANEENGLRGGTGYGEYAKTAKEKHIAAIESDAGGFAPRAFSCSLPANRGRKVRRWLPALSSFEIDRVDFGGGGGADIGPLAQVNTVLFGLEPESQRYFDYHHSHNDTIDKVNPRELQLGALSIALLAWLISEEGKP